MSLYFLISTSFGTLGKNCFNFVKILILAKKIQKIINICIQYSIFQHFQNLQNNYFAKFCKILQAISKFCKLMTGGGGVGATPETRHGIGQPLRGNLRRRIDGSSKVAAGKEPPAAVIAVAKADALLLRAATSFGANA